MGFARALEGMMRKQIVGIATLAVLIGGCAGSTPSPTAQAASAAPAAVTLEEAKVALMGARRMWKDPESIRDSRIGQVYSSGCWGHFEHIATPPDACICVATNAKNSYGGYAGLKPQIALLKGGSVIDLIDVRMHEQNQCATMLPWPEFDGRQRP